MLLIGSRAIRYHLPSFREPKDWDLIASEDELQRVAQRLSSNWFPPRPGHFGPVRKPNPPDDKKHFFRYDGNLVEVARIQFLPYWEKVHQCFSDAPILEDPVLGSLRIAPLDYLLLTKQCGLVFPITHWHKNLLDVYVLRDVVHTVSSQMIDLWPECIRDSTRMFQNSHKNRQSGLQCCHPSTPSPDDMGQHLALHRILEGNANSQVSLDIAWNGFPDLDPPARKTAMIAHLCAEAQIVAVERMQKYLTVRRDVKTDSDSLLTGTTNWLRWTLREMAIGPFPIEWRYFIVNHYREIRDGVPPRWTDPLRDIILTGQSL